MSRMPYLATICWLLLTGIASADVTYDFGYSGRLTDSGGKPYDGSVALSISFFRSATGGVPLLTVTDGLGAVPMNDGIFQVSLSLVASDYSLVFASVSDPVYVQITDLTHAAAAPYPRQQVSMVPYAAKVPVDGKTVGFNAEGQLSLATAGNATAGQFLTEDSNGNFVWAAPAGGALSASGGILSGSLTISSGGESLSGGLNNNGGGITNAGTVSGVGPSLTGAGALSVAAGGTAQNLTLRSSTSGAVNLGSGNGTALSVLDAGSTTADHVTVTGSAAAGSPVIGTAGSDANINLTLSPKGSGNTVIASGYLGIGTTSPAAQLHLLGASSFVKIEDSGSTVHGLKLRGNGVDGASISQADADGVLNINNLYATTSAAGLNEIRFNVGGGATNAMSIQSDGKIGIGTTAPRALLDLEATNTSDVPRGDVVMARYWPNDADTRASSIFHYHDSSGSRDFFAIGVAGDGGYTSAPNQLSQIKMVVGADGKVGIGTISPDDPLEVASSASGAVGGRVTVKNAAAPMAGASAEIGFKSDVNFTGSSYSARIVSSVNANALDESDLLFYIYHSGFGQGVERMRITSDGNVGIGTTSPTAALDVGAAGVASTPALKLDGGIFTGGTATTTKPQLLVEPAGVTSTSWSTGGTAIGANVPAGFSGRLLDLRQDGNSYFDVDQWGQTETTSLTVRADIAIGDPAMVTAANAVLGRMVFRGVTTAYSTINGVQMTSTMIDPTDGSQTTALTFGTYGNGAAIDAMTLRGGNVGIGTADPSNTLHVVGSVCVKASGTCAGSAGGTIYVTNAVSTGADLAEHMPVEDTSLVAGDVVAIERSNTSGDGVFAKSAVAYQKNAVGVVSTRPGVALGSDTKSSQPVALAGRVPANVTLQGGPISVGDYLVASSTPGKAMRAADSTQGGIIGIALSSYDGTWVATQEQNDGVAHEQGHQVMMLVQPLAVSPTSVGTLSADNERLKADNVQLKADMVRLKAGSVRKDAEVGQLKAYLCTNDPAAGFCAN